MLFRLLRDKLYGVVVYHEVITDAVVVCGVEGYGVSHCRTVLVGQCVMRITTFVVIAGAEKYQCSNDQYVEKFLQRFFLFLLILSSLLLFLLIALASRHFHFALPAVEVECEGLAVGECYGKRFAPWRTSAALCAIAHLCLQAIAALHEELFAVGGFKVVRVIALKGFSLDVSRLVECLRLLVGGIVKVWQRVLRNGTLRW